MPRFSTRPACARPAGATTSSAATGPRGPDGRWQLENLHDDQLDVGTGEVEGEPSRWITLRAMRVLRWYAGR
jgi:hypothetical protein